MLELVNTAMCLFPIEGDTESLFDLLSMQQAKEVK